MRVGFGTTWAISARIRAWLVRFGSSPTRSAAAWCAEVSVQEHGGVAGRTPCGPIGRGVPGVTRRLEQPPDIQGVVVAESAGIRVGFHDQGGTDIGKRHPDVNLGGVRQDRAGRDVHGRQPQGIQEAGYLVDDEVAVRLVGHQAPKV